MKVIKPSVEIFQPLPYDYFLDLIEFAGRTCYQSEDKIEDGSAEKFVRGLIRRGHESVLEHGNITVKFICDRGVSHEIVRHRIAAYSQESTRYCNYSNGKFGNEITVIDPCFWPHCDVKYHEWYSEMEEAEMSYLQLISSGATPQEARSVLPNSLKTALVMTANIREWRHFLKLRTSPAAHPQIREVAIMLLNQFKEKYPVFFEDIEV